jgi:hypothetical protein
MIPTNRVGDAHELDDAPAAPSAVLAVAQRLPRDETELAGHGHPSKVGLLTVYGVDFYFTMKRNFFPSSQPYK